MPTIESLSKDITELRQQLHLLLLNKDNYHSKKIVTLSNILDDKIIEYMLLTQQK